MIALVLAAGVGLGVPPSGLAVAALAAYFPVPAACLVVVLFLVSRKRPPTHAALFCEAVAGELQSGDTLRNAVAHAARHVQSTSLAVLCESGASIEEIARAAGEEFQEIGPELAVLLARSTELGAPTSELFGEVADVALNQAVAAQEAAVATAPVRATAFVMMGALGFGLIWAFASGLDRYLGSRHQLIAAASGLGLVIAGAVVALLMFRRAM